MEVPINQDKLSLDWLQEVIGDVLPLARAESYTCERIGEAYGFASELFRCGWLTDGYPYSVVVKRWRRDGKAGDREILFYEQFADCGVRVPACYFAQIEANATAILVLEEIANGFHLETETLTRQHAIHLAHNLGHMHGKWVGGSQLEETPWLVDVSMWTPSAEWLRSRRRDFLTRFGQLFDAAPLQLLNHVEAAPPFVNAVLGQTPVTLLHNDLHLDNVLFVDGATPVFFDWSAPARGPAALNLADLCFSMCPIGLFDAVFDAYFAEFSRASAVAIERRTFEKQLGAALVQRFVRGTCGVARWHPTTERGARVLESGIRQMNRAVLFWLERHPTFFAGILI